MPKRLLTPEQERSLMAEVELLRRLSDKALAMRYNLTLTQLQMWLYYRRRKADAPQP